MSERGHNDSIVLTITCRRDFASARVLRDSLRQHSPGWPAAILIVDDIEGNFADGECSKEWLPIPPLSLLRREEYLSLAYGYNARELIGALKPLAIRYLTEKGYEKVYFFEASVVILSEMSELSSRLDDADIVIIPNLPSRLAKDASDNETQLLQVGAFSGSFLGVRRSENSTKFLAWWGTRLQRYCSIDADNGLYLDQKWLNLVPGMFGRVMIWRALGAMANPIFRAREIFSLNPPRLVSGETILFANLGQRPSDTLGYSDVVTREPLMVDLLGWYERKLADNDVERYASERYAFDSFSNGIRFDECARRALRAATSGGLRFHDPSDASAPVSFFSWLGQPSALGKQSSKPFVTNYTYQLWKGQIEIQGRFWDLFNDHRASFLRWFVDESRISRGFSILARREAVRAELELKN